MPILGKSISLKKVSGIGSCMLVLVLGFPLIAGDCLGVVCLLKGDCGPNPDISRYLGVWTSVNNSGGLSPSALTNYSSPDMVTICGLASESELSGALNLWLNFL